MASSGEMKKGGSGGEGGRMGRDELGLLRRWDGIRWDGAGRANTEGGGGRDG